MDLGNVAARKLHDSRMPIISCVRSRQHVRAGRFRSFQGLGQVVNVVTSQLVPIRIGQMPISYQYGHLTESRLDADAPIRVFRSPNFDTGRAGIVGDDFTMRKLDEAMDERVGHVWGYVYSILGHGLQLRIRGHAGVPIELRVHTTGKLDNYVAADGIVERRNDDACAGRPGRANRS